MAKENKNGIGREVVKWAIELPAAYGTGYLVGTILSAFVPAGAKIPVKICCYVGGVVIAEVITEYECKWVDKTVDGVADAIAMLREIRKANKEISKYFDENGERITNEVNKLYNDMFGKEADAKGE